MIKLISRNELKVYFLALVFIFVCWCGNLYKLSKLDFKPSYKAEIVRAIGLFPPASIITVWLTFEEEI